MTVSKQQTYYEVARHLDTATGNRIRSSRELPAEWKENAHLKLAHGLYWEEYDAEILAAGRVTEHHRQCGIACALAEEPFAQHPHPVREAHIMPSDMHIAHHSV